MNKLFENIQLSKEQVIAYQSIKWLYSIDEKNRRTGRSYLQAIIFLEKAFENIGMHINIEDHFKERDNNSRLIYLIRGIFEDNLKDHFILHMCHQNSTIKLEHKI